MSWMSAEPDHCPGAGRTCGSIKEGRAMLTGNIGKAEDCIDGSSSGNGGGFQADTMPL